MNPAAPMNEDRRHGARAFPLEGTEVGVAIAFEEQARRYQELMKRASDLRSYL